LWVPVSYWAEVSVKESSCAQLSWIKEMSEEHIVKKDVMTSYNKNLKVVVIFENLFLNCKIFFIHHHFTRELTEEKIVTYGHVITRDKSGGISSKGLNKIKLTC